MHCGECLPNMTPKAFQNKAQILPDINHDTCTLCAIGSVHPPHPHQHSHPQWERVAILHMQAEILHLPSPPGFPLCPGQSQQTQSHAQWEGERQREEPGLARFWEDTGMQQPETECLEVGRMGHTDVLEHFGLLKGGGYRGTEALECYTAGLWGVMDSRWGGC